MAERTSPTDALEKLAWELSFHPGETLSLNQISESTGLAWATVRKYTRTLELLQKLAPTLRVREEGLQVGTRSDAMRDLFNQPASALAAYLFIHAKEAGDATEPLPWSRHEHALAKFGPVLERMEDLGWIDRDEETIRLTPLGVSIAGPTYNEVLEAEPRRDLHQEHEPGQLARALVDEGTSEPGAAYRETLASSLAGPAKEAEQGKAANVLERGYPKSFDPDHGLKWAFFSKRRKGETRQELQEPEPEDANAYQREFNDVARGAATV